MPIWNVCAKMAKPKPKTKPIPPPPAAPDPPNAAEVLDAIIYPSGFALRRFGVVLYPWQAEATDAFVKPGTRVALRTCNESGKTSTVIACTVLWHMETFPGSLTITTSATNRQIEDQLYPALRRLVGRDSLYRITHNRVEYIPNGSVCVSFSTDDAGRAEGWHAPQLPPDVAMAYPLREYLEDAKWDKIKTPHSSLYIVVDEAKSVEGPIFEAFERCRPTRYLIASSPGGSLGDFYDAFNSRKWRYNCVVAGADKCPHLWDEPAARRDIEDRIKLFGVDHPLIKSSVFAEFADATEYPVFDAAAVEAAMSGINPRWGLGDRGAGLDLSGGGDQQVLTVRDGNEMRIDSRWRERDDRQLVDNTLDRLKACGIAPNLCRADNGGLGAIILNEFDRRNKGLTRIDFGGKPDNPQFYADRRSEMYFELAHKIRRHETRLPRDPELKQQLLWHTYIPDGKVLKVVPKHKFPHSPDEADSTVLCYSSLPPAVQFEERNEQVKIAASHTMLKPDSEFWQAREDATGSGLFE